MTGSEHLTFFLTVTAPALDCPTAPAGQRVFRCPVCKASCGLHYGRRGGKWFILHESTGFGQCKHSGQRWRSEDKEDCVKFFEEDTGANE